MSGWKTVPNGELGILFMVNERYTLTSLIWWKSCVFNLIEREYCNSSHWWALISFSRWFQQEIQWPWKLHDGTFDLLILICNLFKKLTTSTNNSRLLERLSCWTTSQRYLTLELPVHQGDFLSTPFNVFTDIPTMYSDAGMGAMAHLYPWWRVPSHEALSSPTTYQWEVRLLIWDEHTNTGLGNLTTQSLNM